MSENEAIDLGRAGGNSIALIRLVMYCTCNLCNVHTYNYLPSYE